MVKHTHRSSHWITSHLHSWLKNYRYNPILSICQHFPHFPKCTINLHPICTKRCKLGIWYSVFLVLWCWSCPLDLTQRAQLEGEVPVPIVPSSHNRIQIWCKWCKMKINWNHSFSISFISLSILWLHFSVKLLSTFLWITLFSSFAI